MVGDEHGEKNSVKGLIRRAHEKKKKKKKEEHMMRYTFKLHSSCKKKKGMDVARPEAERQGSSQPSRDGNK